MRRAIGSRLLLALLGLTLTTFSAHAAEKHLLVMDRDEAVGDTYRIKMRASGNEASSQSLGGQKIGSDMKTISSTLTAVIEVLSLHSDESVERVAITLEDFEGEFNGKPIDIDTTKRLVVTGQDETNSYKYENGGAIEEANTIELLNMITNYIVSGGEDDGESPSDEAIFNLEEPRAVGTSWDCNNDLMAADLAEEGIVADPEQMKSKMSFLSVEDYNDVKCAKLAVSVDFGEIDIPELTKQGFNIDKSDMKLAVNGLLPLDPEVLGGTFELEMRMTMTAGTDIEQGKLRLDIETSHTVKITHLPMQK